MTSGSGYILMSDRILFEYSFIVIMCVSLSKGWWRSCLSLCHFWHICWMPKGKVYLAYFHVFVSYTHAFVLFKILYICLCKHYFLSIFYVSPYLFFAWLFLICKQKFMVNDRCNTRFPKYHRKLSLSVLKMPRRRSSLSCNWFSS